ncbi:hypothetical protein DLJ46_26705 [Micromonospora globispora]|uniref:Uncharacterized protein n=1 Tax=Micromonospora globispora TaxID=1450148 RepID=A0A317JVC0_9ACTN|nr:hypothetical protein DLJ46_26705 [Micromonospora globispora]
MRLRAAGVAFFAAGVAFLGAAFRAAFGAAGPVEEGCWDGSGSERCGAGSALGSAGSGSGSSAVAWRTTAGSVGRTAGALSPGAGRGFGAVPSAGREAVAPAPAARDVA